MYFLVSQGRRELFKRTRYQWAAPSGGVSCSFEEGLRWDLHYSNRWRFGEDVSIDPPMFSERLLLISVKALVAYRQHRASLVMRLAMASASVRSFTSARARYSLSVIRVLQSSRPRHYVWRQNYLKTGAVLRLRESALSRSRLGLPNHTWGQRGTNLDSSPLQATVESKISGREGRACLGENTDRLLVEDAIQGELRGCRFRAPRHSACRLGAFQHGTLRIKLGA